MYFISILAGASLAASAAIELEKRPSGVPDYFQTTPELYAGEQRSLCLPLMILISLLLRPYADRHTCYAG